ncbi:MAG: helix-turn-helix transcriptional regulator [Geopsychrobacter sp.]|nr:helix-turn-helix transcriptional regulator [Geopsychrobacter sp.]
MSEDNSTSADHDKEKMIRSALFGERLKQFRKKKCGLVQDEFGESLGVSLATITRLERGKVQAQGDFLAKLVELYNCDLRWLLTGESKSAETKSEVVRNDRIYSMLKAQRTDWQRIIECTMTSVDGGTIEQKQRAEKSIEEERNGIAYLDALLAIGEEPD